MLAARLLCPSTAYMNTEAAAAAGELISYLMRLMYVHKRKNSVMDNREHVYLFYFLFEHIQPILLLGVNPSSLCFILTHDQRLEISPTVNHFCSELFCPSEEKIARRSQTQEIRGIKQ